MNGEAHTQYVFLRHLHNKQLLNTSLITKRHDITRVSSGWFPAFWFFITILYIYIFMMISSLNPPEGRRYHDDTIIWRILFLFKCSLPHTFCLLFLLPNLVYRRILSLYCPSFDLYRIHSPSSSVSGVSFLTIPPHLCSKLYDSNRSFHPASLNNTNIHSMSYWPPRQLHTKL